MGFIFTLEKWYSDINWIINNEAQYDIAVVANIDLYWYTCTSI